MSEFNRRKFLEGSASVAATATLGTGTLFSASANAQTLTLKPEKGATLRVLRWSRFVQGDIDAYMANVKKFTDKTGIPVRVDNEGWEDVRPKAAVAANTGAGPDIILSTNDDANLYPDKLLDVTDVAEYIGKKYGPWYPACEAFLRPDGKKWIGIPLGSAGAMLVYRGSMVKAAGFDTFPKDTDGFLKLMKALHAKGTPGGMALGNATGDGLWCNWLIWAFGGKLVDEKNKVVIDSPETQKALEYGKELYATFIPGTLSWLDPNNNKAFLDGQISLTNNGISIYYATKTSTDPKVKELQADVQHANYPIGPVGVPTESHLFFNQMIMKYTKYPQAAKEFLRFMMEKEQFDPVVDRRRCVHRDAARRLRESSDLDRRPEAHALSRPGQEHASCRLRRQAGLRIGRRGRRLHRRQHGGRGNQRVEDTEGSDGTRAEARREVLQSLIARSL